MRFCILILTIFLVPQVSFAKDSLEIISAEIVCRESDHPRGKYDYRVGVVVKNISSQDVTLITGRLSPGISLTGEGDFQQVILQYVPAVSVEGDPLIPSASDLKLVHLKPGEATGFHYTKRSKFYLMDPIVMYAIEDMFDGRFGNWTGRIASIPVAVDHKESCSLQ